jgi:hapalindole biogenesis HpiC1 cyclase-like protein
MNLKKLALACAFVLSMTILSGTAWADNIPIVNASFETLGASLAQPCGTGCAYNYGPITGWTSTALGAGSFQPGSLFTSIPGGSLIAFVTPTNTLTQTLTGTSVLANSTYTLNVSVGDRAGEANGNYTLSLDTIVGGVTSTLCSFTGNAANIASGTFQVEGCSYTSKSTVPSGNLFLQFTANTGQLDVDNVSLSVQSASTSVPEPSSALLSSVGMLFLVATMMVRRKKELQLTA